MYKNASRFHQSAPDLNRPAHHDREPVAAEWAVVAFREGRDNQRRKCVYRRVWTFRSKAHALQHLDHKCPTYPCAILIRQGCPVHIVDHDLVDRWMQQRKGLNLDANPWASSGYMRREQGGADEWAGELKP